MSGGWKSCALAGPQTVLPFSGLEPGVFAARQPVVNGGPEQDRNDAQQRILEARGTRGSTQRGDVRGHVALRMGTCRCAVLRDHAELREIRPIEDAFREEIAEKAEIAGAE